MTEQASTAIELALIFKVSPFDFLGLSKPVLAELYRQTTATLERLKPPEE